MSRLEEEDSNISTKIGNGNKYFQSRLEYVIKICIKKLIVLTPYEKSWV